MQGPLVYVNYGRIEDFMYLTNGTYLKLDLSKYKTTCTRQLVMLQGHFFLSNAIKKWRKNIINILT